jgi:hypothetical protein
MPLLDRDKQRESRAGRGCDVFGVGKKQHSGSRL